MTEIWKDIEGYEGYQVSNLGRIRSVDRTRMCGKRERRFKGRILKEHFMPNGYLQACFPEGKSIYIHRAVAFAFVPGYFEGAQVNHIDENPHNNRWDNLEWVTPKQNINHGNCISKIRNSLEKLYGCTIEQYTKEGEFIATYPSIHAAARATGANRRNITKSLDTNHVVKGYLFKRKTPPS